MTQSSTTYSERKLIKGSKRPVLFIFIFFLAVLLGGGIFFIQKRFQAEQVKEHLVAAVDEMLNASVEFGSFQLSRLPRPTIHLVNAQLRPKEQANLLVSAEEVDLDMSIMGLLLGKYHVSRIRIHKGRVSVEVPARWSSRGVQLTNIEVDAKNVNPDGSAVVNWKADFQSIQNAIKGAGKLRLPQADIWDWTELSFTGVVELNDTPIEGWKYLVEPVLPFTLRQGKMTTFLNLEKNAGETELSVSGDTNLNGFVYELAEESSFLRSSEMDVVASYKMIVDPDTGYLNVENIHADFPVMKLDIHGDYNFETKSISEIRISLTEMELENVPQYITPLKELIPFNIGFSGKSTLEMTLSGSLNDLKIHTHWDLSPALLTYARYFSKPKEMPFDFTSGLEIKDGNMLGGEFSLKFQEMIAKGTLTDVNLETGVGLFNLITNKFSLNGWEQLVPPLADYAISGEMKILANFKGDLRNLAKTENVLNVTVDGGNLVKESGEGLSNIMLSLDHGPVAFEMKDTSFDVKGKPVELDVQVYSLQEVPVAKVSMQSDEVEPLELMRSIQSVLGNLGESEKVDLDWNGFVSVVESVFPEGQSANRFSLNVESEAQGWALNHLNFEAYGGFARFQGGLRRVLDMTDYWIDADIRELNLAKFGARREGESSQIDGKLFANANFEGSGLGADWADSLTGQGSLLITSGEFHSFNIFEALTRIRGFESASELVQGGTEFHDLDSKFVLSEGRFVTDNMFIKGENYTANGKGNLSFDGLLNYRLDVYLPQSVAENMTGKIVRLRAVGDEALGPIPMLLSGSFENPDLKPDPAALPDLAERLFSSQGQSALRNFLPEDAFLDRRKDS